MVLIVVWDFCLQMSIRDWIYLLSSNNKQIRKLYETMFFKILDIRQQRIGIPERWAVNKVSPTAIPTACLVRIPSQWCREGELRWRQILITKLSRLYWGSGKIKAASDHRTEYQKGDICTEKALKRSADNLPRVFRRLLIRACMWGN